MFLPRNLHKWWPVMSRASSFWWPNNSTDSTGSWRLLAVNTWKPEQNGRYFADNILKCIFFYNDILVMISQEFISNGLIDNKSGLVQVMACRLTGHFLNQWWLSLLMHHCIIRPQWVNSLRHKQTWPLLADNISEDRKYLYFNPNSIEISFFWWSFSWY